MLNTNCVKHAYKYFFMFTDDYLDVAELFCLNSSYSVRQSYPFAVSLRVLETWKNDLLKKLNEDGITEEQLAENEELLWMDAEWQPFCNRALHIFEERTFQKTLPRVIEAGFARQRYIKRDVDGHRVCNEAGQLLVYATYQQARRDKQHPGEIIHQVLFLSEAVNAAIAGLSPSPSPSPSPDSPEGGDGPKTKSGDAHAQGGNLVTQSSPAKDTHTARGGNPDTVAKSSDGNIPHPSQKCEGEGTSEGQLSYTVSHNTVPSQKNEGPASASRSMFRKNAQGVSGTNEGAVREASQKDEGPVRKNASNKNLSNKNLPELLEESLSGAAGAGVNILSHFDFFRNYDQAAIQDLAALIMPLPENYKSETRREAAQLATEQAAEKLADNPFLRDRGLVHTARLLSYLKDPASPCSWRKKIHKDNPGMQLRLWHVSEKVARLASREMERFDWWPVGLSPAIVEPTPVDETIAIDLAEIAGIAPPERVGMDRSECLDLVAYLRQSFPSAQFDGVFVDYGSVDRQKSRGYFIEFWYADGRMIRLYSYDDWNLVASHAEALDTPDFAARLAQALREKQVA